MCFFSSCLTSCVVVPDLPLPHFVVGPLGCTTEMSQVPVCVLPRLVGTLEQVLEVSGPPPVVVVFGLELHLPLFGSVLSVHQVLDVPVAVSYTVAELVNGVLVLTLEPVGSL